MNYGKLLVLVAAFALWAMMPRGSACAQTCAGAGIYDNCSTPVTVGPNSSSGEQQVMCNGDDSATGGGIEVTSPALPLPPSTIVTTPENSFVSYEGTPLGWQVVVQDTNLDPSCIFKPQQPKCSIQFRVCVACYTSCLGTGSASGGL
jgi:hypothetical protein